MKHLALLFILSGAVLASAAEGPESVGGQADDEVVVTLTVQGANEMSKELATSMGQLADALNKLQSSGIELSQEELDKLDAVLESAHVLVTSVGDNASQLDVAINNAREPLLGLTTDVMNTARVEAIQPVIDELNLAIKRAFRSALLLLILLALGVALVLWLVSRRLLPLMSAMQKIMHDHVIVPRERWPADSFDLTPDEVTYAADQEQRDPNR